jgi:hypothetical protein
MAPCRSLPKYPRSRHDADLVNELAAFQACAQNFTFEASDEPSMPSTATSMGANPCMRYVTDKPDFGLLTTMSRPPFT